MKNYQVLFILVIGLVQSIDAQTISADKDWKLQTAVIHKSKEADLILRIGDIDNLGFGWESGFDPFCGRTTQVHPFPWEVDPEENSGFDRMLVSSKLQSVDESPCGFDGYSSSVLLAENKVPTYKLNLEPVKEYEILRAHLQLFIDDFQAPDFCSSFRISLNDMRFEQGERVLNAISQTGPVGKLINLPISEEFYPLLKNGGDLSIRIDENKGMADGWAVDFIRLLINRNPHTMCLGELRGFVVDKETGAPIPHALVSTTENQTTTTDGDGYFVFQSIPTGYQLITAGAEGYNSNALGADIGEGSDNPELTIPLSLGSSTKFNGQDIRAGESILLKNIMFDQSSSVLRPESKLELDKVADFLTTNQGAQIQLSGHTSGEGDADYNRSLSYKRVKACKDYIIAKGIEFSRVLAIGYGPDLPIAPNDTEPNRAKNRRVEMQILKL